MGNLTFILNVEDTRRKSKNFSTNLTRGVDLVTDALIPRVPELPSEPEDPNIILDSLDRLLFNLVVRDFETEFGGNIIAPDISLTNQVSIPLDDSDFYEDQFDFDISDNANPRVNLNNTIPLKIRLGEESFASAVLSLDSNYEVKVDVGMVSMSMDLFKFGWEVGAPEGDLDIETINLSLQPVEFSETNFVNTNPVIINLITDFLSVQINSNAEPITNNFSLQRSLDSGINIQLPTSMVTSPDFDPS